MNYLILAILSTSQGTSSICHIMYIEYGHQEHLLGLHQSFLYAFIFMMPKYYKELLSKENWKRPRLENIRFDRLLDEKAAFVEKSEGSIDNLGRVKALSFYGFPLAFFQSFWNVLKDDVVAFVKEFFERERPSSEIGASFIAIIPKFEGAECLKDFRSISLIESPYKILAKILASIF
ncbi:uncharacterized protein LOC131247096 [Magnolia sinica]|uniref:uncharacterized protein LOC131247096 n=1 Tax=Magnolia sinica TaxID=86752 RepID=UPI0026593BBC|nr:uncharacterized protein LOC131247096 [Magnolia sinica]